MQTISNPLEQNYLFEQMTNITKAHGCEILSEQVKELKEENEKVKRLLHDLTPDGSEFYNDPEYCAKFIKETHKAEINTLAKIVVSLKKEIATLQNKIS